MLDEEEVRKDLHELCYIRGFNEQYANELVFDIEKIIYNKANQIEPQVMPKIADLKKQNSKLIALLQMRDGGDHDKDCKANYGRQCSCGHDTVKLYFDNNSPA